MIFVVTFYQHEARQVPEQEGEGGDSSAFWRPELVLPLKKKRLGGVFGGSFSPLVPSPGQVLPSAAAEGSRSDGPHWVKPRLEEIWGVGTFVSHPDLQIQTPARNSPSGFRGLGAKFKGGLVLLER